MRREEEEEEGGDARGKSTTDGLALGKGVGTGDEGNALLLLHNISTNIK